MEEDEEFKTTVEEVAKVIYDTDVYEDVKLITSKSDTYDLDSLFFKIFVEINTYYLEELRNHSLRGERNAFLAKQIKRELQYYVMHRKK